MRHSNGLLKLGFVAVGSMLLAAGATLAVQPTQPSLETATVDVRALDLSTPACRNFYQHACGGFLASAKPTESRPEISLFDDAFDARLQAELEQLFRQPAAPGSELGRLKTFYASCRRSMTDESNDDHALLQTWLTRIEEAPTRTALITASRDLDAIGVEPFFVLDVTPDPADWSRWYGSLGAADPVGDTGKVQQMFELSGLPPERAGRDAASVAAITTELDKAQKSDSHREGAQPQLTWTQVAALAPNLNWPAYRRLVGERGSGRVEVPSRAYVSAVGKVFHDRSPAELRAYLRWRLLLSLRGELPHSYAPVLRTLPVYLRGNVDDPDQRCRDATVRAMGVSFSRQFATRILGNDARAQALRLSKEIRSYVIASIGHDDWLSPEARARTVDKLQKEDLHIGFPDRWPATGNFALDDRRFLANVLAARRFEQQQKWERAGKLRDRSQWQEEVYPWVGIGMASARLVIPNGFPDTYSNSLVMTAAFLMPPRFSAQASPEANFATYGAIFGHELTHVLEDHTDDAEGRPNDLWTAADIKAHDQRQQCVIDQADAFTPAPGLKNPGKRQADENIADLGGVRLAHAALASRLGAAMTVRGTDGRTPEQRFFYRYAQQYCTAQTLERLAAGVARDGHGPVEFRVNGPLSNLPAFASAFGCHVGDGMVRPAEKMCRIW